ncbi:MAG: hypothetical protein WC777_05770 [Candidatus Gracilibacteria bacterium]
MPRQSFIEGKGGLKVHFIPKFYTFERRSCQGLFNQMEGEFLFFGITLFHRQTHSIHQNTGAFFQVFLRKIAMNQELNPTRIGRNLLNGP